MDFDPELSLALSCLIDDSAYWAAAPRKSAAAIALPTSANLRAMTTTGALGRQES